MNGLNTLRSNKVFISESANNRAAGNKGLKINVIDSNNQYGSIYSDEPNSLLKLKKNKVSIEKNV